ncbi:undecaprenyldiphospho-muramoylpentapeptide beta-N-acetylglucosaminyltransferase [Alphaproteobacteria bacterium LSUCC0684]
MTTVFLAAGGTGGHVFPAVAIAESLTKEGIRPVFITDRRGKRMIPAEYRSWTILAASPYGSSLFIRLKGMTKLLLGCLETCLAIAWHRPRMVIGFGGYPAVPPVMIGRLFGLPLIIHEQNAFLGRANRFLSARGDVLALSWPETRNIPAAAADKVLLAGMPVRSGFHQISRRGYAPPETDGPIHILIVGGSLGARVFGETVPEAISRLPEKLRSRLRVTHQVRGDQMEAIRAQYARHNVSADLHLFITDMPAEMEKAHLVICRAGASSVAELAAAGRPAVFVPYPHAMDDHQTANAMAAAAIGGGWCVPEAEMSAGSLAGRIASLVSDGETLSKAAAAIGRLNPPDPARTLTTRALELLSKGRAS